MLNILDTAALLERRDELKSEFNKKKDNHFFLKEIVSTFEEIEEWKYSSGAIFDVPPYEHEMAGFDGGKLIKKNYETPYQARLKGVYSSGFINKEHRITVTPSKPESIPLHISRFTCTDSRTVNSEYIKLHTNPQSRNPIKLISISIFFEFQTKIWASIGVGAGESYSIILYYYNNDQLIEKASLVTAPFDRQSEYQMHYDTENNLVSIRSGSMVVWEDT